MFKIVLKYEWVFVVVYNIFILLEIYWMFVNVVSYNFREYLEIKIDVVYGIYLSRVCKLMNFLLKFLD